MHQEPLLAVVPHVRKGPDAGGLLSKGHGGGDVANVALEQEVSKEADKETGLSFLLTS